MPQCLVLDTITQNLQYKLNILQSMIDENSKNFVAQFQIPAYCPASISLPMKNGRKVSEVVDSELSPAFWRDIDEGLRLEWVQETVGDHPTNFSFDHMMHQDEMEIVETSSGERYLQSYAASSLGSEQVSASKYVGNAYFSSGVFLKWSDVQVTAQSTLNIGTHPQQLSWWFTGIANEAHLSANMNCGVLMVNGYIFFLQDLLITLIHLPNFADWIPYSVGMYNIGDRIFFVEIIDATAMHSQIWKDGVALDSGTPHPFYNTGYTPDSLAYSTIGVPTISKLFSSGVAIFQHGISEWSDYVNFQWRYCGIEGSIAKMLCPIQLEIDEIAMNANLARNAIFPSEYFIEDALNTQLHAANPNISGLELVGIYDKYALVIALDQFITPNAENISKIVSMFAGIGNVTVRDTKPMQFSVLIPIGASGLWGLAQNGNFTWLLDVIRPIATKVTLGWLFIVSDLTPWTPQSWVELLYGIISEAFPYHWNPSWDDSVSHWGDGAWDALLDRVKMK